jgi:hypothetical protein
LEGGVRKCQKKVASSCSLLVEEDSEADFDEGGDIIIEDAYCDNAGVIYEDDWIQIYGTNL